jgi:branched-chain amino acid transport system permease protein
MSAVPDRRRAAKAQVSWAVAALALAALPPLLVSRGSLEDFSRVFVIVLAVLGVSILTGTTGLISLGHAVFVGVGAFSMANLLDEGLPVVVALLLATLIAGVAGMIVAVPALRVSGPYLALITLGVAVMFPPIARRGGTFTGAALGRTVDVDGFDPPDFLHLDERPHIWNYVVCLFVIAVWFWIARNLLHSRMGRAIRATKDHEHAAAAFGVNITTAKLGIFGVSAAMAGTAGALQALIDPYLNANGFDWRFSLELYTSAVIGGLGSLLGAVIGVVVYISIPWLNEAVGLLDNASLAFGIGLLIVILVAPTGIVGQLDRLRGGIRRIRRRNAEPPRSSEATAEHPVSR